MRRPQIFFLVACSAACRAAAFHARPVLGAGRNRVARIAAQADILGTVDDWFLNFPYQSAFAVTGFKALCADLLTQTSELRRAQDMDSESTSTLALETCDDVSCEVVEVTSGQSLSKRRALAFLLYGGLYQGCVQYFLFNVCFPVWFGEGTDVQTVITKVLVDQFILTPFLCLPTLYLVKAIIFNYPLRDGLERYVSDAQKDLLIKYWVLWGPVQCITFGVMPPQYRVVFIALVSFFWLLVLSSISSREEGGAAGGDTLVATEPPQTRA